ncbi:MAG: hypothetical protein EPN88_12385 [Bacteroidetes bacterium]|nr:MAG: hypothetical protein EPN88_12385 [Bacteroidota bacterium]
MKTKLLLSALLSFYFCLLSSQVPQGFNYQAIARDGATAITIPLTVQITIQSASDGGTLFWVEKHFTVQPDDQGLFSLVVGRGVRQDASTVSNFSDIDWSVTPKYIKTEIDYNGWQTMGSSELLTVPYSMVAKAGTVEKLGVKGTTTNMTEALFEVKNFNNQTVFAVYNDGVRAYVDKITTKGAKGGFAIGGFGKGQDYLVVDPGNIKMYIDDQGLKGAKGGFAIGGFGTKGGNFFNVDAADVANVSGNKVLWYPLKNAFLSGKVLIASPTDVGENSFVSGFESKATGDYSQSMGYKTVALGEKSTAMGNESRSEGPFSFAMGLASVASGNSAAAIGGYCTASAGSAMAMGWLSTASGVASFASGNGCNASAPNSQAMGWGSSASGEASTAIGNACEASGKNSFAFGDISKASNDNSYAFGKSSLAKGLSSYAFGEGVTAGSLTNGNCYAFGKSTQATGSGSYAFGDGAIASGTYATAFGKSAQATNTSSFAFGESAQATSANSFALGLGATAFGQSCYAFGESAQASNQNSFALGKGATASGSNSYAFGAWGQDDPNFGTNKPGSSTIASGNNSFAAGQGAVASGDNSVSIGFCTRAGSQACVAMGMGSIAEGNHSAIAIGEYAKSFGYGSVAMGSWTYSTGMNSVALGYATHSITNFSTAIGIFNLGLSNSLFEIGNGFAEEARSNVLTVLGNGNMGLGTSAPDTKLEVAVTGNNANAGIGINRTSEGGKLISLNQGEVGKLNFTVPGVVDLVTFDYNTLRVGIGTTAPGYTLHVNGSVAGIGAYVSLSDKRFKKDVQPITGALNKIMELQGITFNWDKTINPELNVDDNNHIGFSAQDIEKILPQVVSTATDKMQTKSVAYSDVVPVLVEAIKEQQTQIESSQEENRQLRTKLQTLENRIGQIESLLAKTSTN